LKTYELEFDVDALKEWHKLDGSVKVQLKNSWQKGCLRLMYRLRNFAATFKTRTKSN
jgi:mRNA-degrading endonuclease RelE of RelBE toxin-antitoxin system